MASLHLCSIAYDIGRGRRALAITHHSCRGDDDKMIGKLDYQAERESAVLVLLGPNLGIFLFDISGEEDAIRRGMMKLKKSCGREESGE